MSKQESDDGQRRDALLRRLLKSPPQSRTETAEQLRRAKEEAKRKRISDGKSASRVSA